MLERWGADAPDVDGLTKSEAAIQLWRTWRAGDLSARGRRVLRIGAEPVLAIWSGGPERPSLWLATASELEAALGPLWTAQPLEVSLSDTDGQPFWAVRAPAASP